MNLTDIHSLTDFQRNVKAHLKHLKETGRPEGLTITGKAAVVVQYAESYQRLLELVDQAEAVEGIQRGLDDVTRGRTRSMRSAMEELGQEVRQGDVQKRARGQAREESAPHGRELREGPAPQPEAGRCHQGEGRRQRDHAHAADACEQED